MSRNGETDYSEWKCLKPKITIPILVENGCAEENVLINDIGWASKGILIKDANQNAN